MKFSNGIHRSESGEAMRRSLSYLRARMNFRQSGSPLAGKSPEEEQADRFDIKIEDIPVSFVVADDVVACGGLVMVQSKLDQSFAFQLFTLNPVLLALHDACFSWCDKSLCFIFSRRIPDALVRDEDDLFDFAVECVRLMGRSEKAVAGMGIDVSPDKEVTGGQSSINALESTLSAHHFER